MRSGPLKAYMKRVDYVKVAGACEECGLRGKLHRSRQDCIADLVDLVRGRAFNEASELHAIALLRNVLAEMEGREY